MPLEEIVRDAVRENPTAVREIDALQPEKILRDLFAESVGHFLADTADGPGSAWSALAFAKAGGINGELVEALREALRALERVEALAE